MTALRDWPEGDLVPDGDCLRALDLGARPAEACDRRARCNLARAGRNIVLFVQQNGIRCHGALLLCAQNGINISYLDDNMF